MRLLSILIAVSVTLLWLAWSRPRDAIRWTSELEEALELARRERRPLLVHFTRADRALAAEMDERTWTDADLAELVGSRFVALRLEGERHAGLLERWSGCAGALASVVIDPGGGSSAIGGSGRDFDGQFAGGGSGADRGMSLLAVRLGHARADELRQLLARAHELEPELRQARARTSLDPTDVASWLRRAAIATELGLAREAEHALRSAIGGAPEPASRPERARLARGHAELAHVLVRRGEALAAREHCERARELDPGERAPCAERVLLCEALALSVERREREAVLLLERGFEIFPEGELCLERRLAYARARHETGDVAGAIASLELLLAELGSAPDSARALLGAAALSELEHVLDPPPDHVH